MNGDIEPQARTEYRLQCRYRSDYDTCLKDSGWSGPFHMTFACTPTSKCQRMRVYDFKHKKPTWTHDDIVDKYGM